MKKKLAVVTVAAVASLSIGAMTAGARPIIIHEPKCTGQTTQYQVEPGTTGDTDGDGLICVTDL